MEDAPAARKNRSGGKMIQNAEGEVYLYSRTRIDIIDKFGQSRVV
jgi:hypothetical protein